MVSLALNEREAKLKKYLKLLRVKHYVKNLLIFIPLFFSQQMLNAEKIRSSILGFLAFSLMASTVYIINDSIDAEKDKYHPKKKNRPIASGAISKKKAAIIAGICAAISIALSIFTADITACAFILIYLGINVAYTLKLKNVPIIDVAILTAGFLFRLMYGAAVSDIEISSWLYLTVMAGAFYMGLGKRRNEIKFVESSKETGKTRSVLKFYTYDFLDKNMYVCLALTDAFYALWAMSRENKYVIWTVPIVMLILMKYSLDIEGDSDGDPVEVIVKDKVLIGLVALYAVVIVAILYVMK